MNKNVEETKKVTTEEEEFDEEFLEEDDLDEADIKLAKTINSAKGKVKKVGKIALVVGGVVVLGAAGLLIAGAVAKANEDAKLEKADYPTSDIFSDGTKTSSEPVEETTEAEV